MCLGIAQPGRREKKGRTCLGMAQDRHSKGERDREREPAFRVIDKTDDAEED